MHLYLNFLGTTVDFEVAVEAEAAFEPVRRFFHHLLAPEPAGRCDFHVSVLPLGPPDGSVPGRPVVIRQSSAPEFTFHARLSRHGARRTYRNEHTALDVPADAAVDRRFRVEVSEGSAIQVIDFIRDLVIRNEETAGTVVLHASAVRRDGQVYAIAGPKGAGKTTTLLSVLGHGGWQYFTGDKLFCRPEKGGITVHAWRDYPYVGVGTLRANPALAANVRRSAAPDLDELSPGHKILLDPDLFESWLGAEFDPSPHRLAGLLLPRVQPGEPLLVEPVTEPNARWAALNTIVDRSVDTTFFGWQHYLVPDYAAFYATLAELRPLLDGLDVRRLSGALDVDLDAVLEETG
ncbi:hypothetical protein [Kitasatospora sp. NBC_01266]|uniref:hypothetical protein n=1 Tax=Kitasatospora sp. NBC_01266 TaxID=2903572 RepID=UPI002E311562|nr:hypothetical protein [Kitasatospora sp. NBC_01266]